MNQVMLETAQMLKEHPILCEDENYKLKYINMLEYFVRKYSPNDLWSNQTLQLYAKKLLGNVDDYRYSGFDLLHDSRYVLALKYRNFKFFSYRYCLIFDCIFICAYEDKGKAEQIFSELLNIYNKRYHKKLCQVFESLYDSSISIDGIEKIRYLKSCWDKNRAFIRNPAIRVIVTANMSAGKSTLLNALAGRKINRTQNDSCTAKIHYILNKPYEDGFCYELDYLLELDADYDTLMEDNSDNHNYEIMVGAFFRTIGTEIKRICFIDTPGVNSSQNTDHRELTEKTINDEKADLLIYLLNGESIGTDDDRKHLLFILEKYHGRILFVVNKLDKFRKKEDSVAATLKAVADDLSKMGFDKPVVIPISAYAAYLAKMKMFAGQITEDEQDEFDRMSRKMRKTEYQFGTYYPGDVQNNVHIENEDDSYQLLLHSGLLHLENMIYNMR